MNHILYILLAFIFVLLNAFFVAAEFAMVRLRTTRVQSIRKKRQLPGKILAKIHQHLDTYLSACQLGITLASLGLGWIGEPAFAHLLQPLFTQFNLLPTEISKLISFICAFATISFLHIVVGELMPKSMAIRQSENISLWTAIPLYSFYWAMFPAIWLLNKSANGLLRLFHLDTVHHGEHTYAPEELKLILKSSKLRGNFALAHQEMMLRMLEFADLQAVDVMRPISEMVSIDTHATLPEVLKTIQHYRYSRYPIYENDSANIIGILHSKDLLVAIDSFTPANGLRNCLRPVLKLQRDNNAIEIFERFQQGMPHFALVYDEGKLIGFITLDTLLRTILGKMRDEFHLTPEDWKLLPSGDYIIKGNAPVYVIEKLVNADLSQYGANTVAGLILQELGHLPRAQEKLEFSTFTLKANKVTRSTIRDVILTFKQ